MKALRVVVNQEEKIYCSEAELAILSLILRDGGLLPRISTYISPHDFRDNYHRAFFEACLALSCAGSPIDLVTVFDQYKKSNKDAGVTERLKLVDIASFGALPTSLEYYAQMLRTESRRRTIKRAGIAMVEAADSDLDTEGLQGKITSFLGDLNSSWVPPTIPNFAERLRLAGDQVKEYDAKTKADPRWMPGIKSGFVHLDNLLFGFQKGFVIIGARPSMGKTAFALCLTENMGLQGEHVAFYSLEMSPNALTKRMWSRHTQFSTGKVPLNTLRTGGCKVADWESLELSQERLSSCSITILDYREQRIDTIEDIEKWSRNLAAGQNPPTIMIVDHIHLIGHPDEKMDRQHQLTDISKRLKRLSEELGIPVVALAQLSRATEEHKGLRYRPTMAHLRECGALEQDADVVMLLYRADYYVQKQMLEERESERHQLEVIVAKQREGKCDTVLLGFDELYGHVFNLTYQGLSWIRDLESEEEEKKKTMELKPAVRDVFDGSGKRFIQSLDGSKSKEVWSEKHCQERVRKAIDEGKLKELEDQCVNWAAPNAANNDIFEYEWRKACFSVMKGAIRDLGAYKEGKPTLFGRLKNDAK